MATFKRTVQRFIDNFSDGSFGMSFTGNGRTRENTGSLIVWANKNDSVNWWSGANEDSPIAYELVSGHVTADCKVVDLHVTAISGPSEFLGGLAVYSDKDNAYKLGYTKGDDAVNAQGIIGDVLATTWANVPSNGPNDTEETYRIIWNTGVSSVSITDMSISVPASTIMWFTKSGAGAWQQIHSRTLDFAPTKIGIFIKRWSALMQACSIHCDYLSLSEVVAGSIVERFRDDFDNETLGLSVEPGGNGYFTEISDTLSLVAKNNENVDWWSGGTETGPIAYELVATHLSEDLKMAEIVLTHMSGPDDSAGGMCVYLNRDNAYLFPFSPSGNINAQGIVSDVAYTWAGTGVASPNVGDHTYRLIWNTSGSAIQMPDYSISVPANSIMWVYKIGSGSWTTLHTRTLDFTPTNAGMWMKRWAAPQEAVTVTYRNFSLHEVDTVTRADAYDDRIFMAAVYDRNASDSKLLYRNGSTAWTPFPIQPSPLSITGNEKTGIFGDPNSVRIWIGLANDGFNGRVSRYEGGSWTIEMLSGHGGTLVHDIHGLDDATIHCATHGNVWARSQAGIWTHEQSIESTLSRVCVVSSTVIYATTTHQVWRKALGSWTNITAALNTLGMTIFKSVWGLGANHVFVIGSPAGGSSSRLQIAFWDGSNWAMQYWEPTDAGDPDEIHGLSIDNVWVIQSIPNQMKGYNRAWFFDGERWDSKNYASHLNWSNASSAQFIHVGGNRADDVVGGGGTYTDSNVWQNNADHTYDRLTAYDNDYNWCGFGSFLDDTTAPTLQNQSPFPGETNVSLTNNIYLEAVDPTPGSGIHASTVVLTVGGVIAWSGDSQQNGHVVAKVAITNGYSYDIDPPSDLPEGQSVNVVVHAEDNALVHNVLDDNYTFYVLNYEPELQNQSPFPGETNVDVDRNIILELVDVGSGLNAASVVLKVNGSTAWQNGAQQGGFAVSISAVSGGYRYEINPDVDLPYQVVNTVGVYAEDTAPTPNVLDTSYNFDTSEFNDPTFSDQFPSPGSSGISRSTLVSVSFNDDKSGVVLSTMGVSISGLQAMVNGVFQSGFQGPASACTPNASNGYDVVVDLETDFPSFTAVQVDVSCQDLAGNTGSTSWVFGSEDYEGPLLTPVDPTANQINVVLDTEITLTLQDDDSVNASTIVVEVDRGSGFGDAFVYSDAPQFKPGYQGPASQVDLTAGVYTIVIDPEVPFYYGDTVEVRVTALDPTGNPERLL